MISRVHLEKALKKSILNLKTNHRRKSNDNISTYSDGFHITILTYKNIDNYFCF